MSNYQKISIILQFCSLFSLIATIFTIFYNLKKNKQQEAPNFVISSVIFQPETMRFPTNAYRDPENSTFLLQKRRVFKDQKLSEPISCLLANICPKVQCNNHPNKIYFYNMNRVQIHNTGFDAISFEITEIYIHQKINDSLFIIEPGKQNTIHQIISTSESLEILITIILDSNANICDISKFGQNYIESKHATTGGELLNTTVDDMIDLWDYMEFYVRSINKYGQKYIQKLRIYIESDTYFSIHSAPKLEK